MARRASVLFMGPYRPKGRQVKQDNMSGRIEGSAGAFWPSGPPMGLVNTKFKMISGQRYFATERGNFIRAEEGI